MFGFPSSAELLAQSQAVCAYACRISAQAIEVNNQQTGRVNIQYLLFKVQEILNRKERFLIDDDGNMDLHQVQSACQAVLSLRDLNCAIPNDLQRKLCDVFEEVRGALSRKMQTLLWNKTPSPKNEEVQYRPMDPCNDLAQVVDIEKPWTSSEFIKKLTHGHCEGLIGYDNPYACEKRIVSAMIVYSSNEILQLLNFAVHHNVRKIGIGIKTMENLQKTVLPQRNMKKIRAIVAPKSSGYDFLVKCDFRVSHVLRDYFAKDGSIVSDKNDALQLEWPNEKRTKSTHRSTAAK
ncbi:MAG: hypothetical protein WCG83_06890 [Candidatus Peregrinibacteria bacterium]